MRACVALLIGVLLTTAALAADIKLGATMQVKSNTIWFDEADQLARWNQLRAGGDAKALAAYQTQLLTQRVGWQFIHQLRVKVLGYDAGKHEAHVQMLTEGRFVGLDFYIDADALTP
jgi:hypothetical protein